MRFLADENCDRQMVVELREAGHDVTYIAEFAPSIEDADFSEMIFRDAKSAYGVIFIHPYIAITT